MTVPKNPDKRRAGGAIRVPFVRRCHIEYDGGVTDSAFLSIMPRVVELFISADVQHFAYDQREAAMAWLSTGLAENV